MRSKSENNTKNKYSDDVILLSSSRRLYSFVIDELCYRFTSWIFRRAQRQKQSLPPMCGLNSDLISLRLISTGTYESTNLEALSSLLKEKWHLLRPDQDKSGLFIDIGANIGIFSTTFANSFSKVLAIEANPVTFRLLEANIMLARATNVRPINIAASNGNANLLLKIAPEGNLGWASIVEHPQNSTGPDLVEVEARRIDAVVDEENQNLPVKLIKVDVEGHELEALKGAVETISRDKPVILFEYNGAKGNDNVYEFLQSLGYQRFGLFEREKSVLRLFAQSKVVLRIFYPCLPRTGSLICAY